jgi:hypothetical protein
LISFFFVFESSLFDFTREQNMVLATKQASIFLQNPYIKNKNGIFLPNDLLTAGWNHTPRRNRVNTRVHTCTLPPTCSHLRPGPTRRRPARARGPLARGTVQTLGLVPARFPFPVLPFLL